MEANTLFWEDMTPGMRWTTPARTITESDVQAFAGLTGDYNRSHTDAEYARDTIFGQRIAHGLLVACISVGLNTRTLENQRMEAALLALLQNTMKFPKPSFFGDTVHVQVEVMEQTETSKADRGIVQMKRTTVNQRGEIVVESTVAMLMRRRG